MTIAVVVSRGLRRRRRRQRRECERRPQHHFGGTPVPGETQRKASKRRTDAFCGLYLLLIVIIYSKLCCSCYYYYYYCGRCGSSTTSKQSSKRRIIDSKQVNLIPFLHTTENIFIKYLPSLHSCTDNSSSTVLVASNSVPHRHTTFVTNRRTTCVCTYGRILVAST